MIALCDVHKALHIGGIAVVLPVVWAYAFFDTFHIHNRTPEQLEQVPDDYLFHLSSLGSGNLHALYEQRHTLLGLSLILVACLLLYNSVVLPLLWDFVPSVVYELFSYVPEIILAVLLILLGLWLLRGPRAPRSEEDYTAYTGAPSAAQPQEMSSEAPQTVEAASSEENRHAE